MRPAFAVLTCMLLVGCRSTVVAPPDVSEPDEPVSFVQDVFPILSSSCALSGCHAGAGTSGVRLASYEEAVSSVGQQYGILIIQPFDAENSPIVDKISGVPKFGQRMPFGGPFLSADDIGLIRAWIDQGALNN